jgi:GntR family transcriptional regulator
VPIFPKRGESTVFFKIYLTGNTQVEKKVDKSWQLHYNIDTHYKKEVAMVRFNIDTASPLPVYLQVKQSILIDVMAGRLKDDDRLPSIRELAKILKLNPNTVAKAYYNLEEEGIIQGYRGSGYLVKCQKTKLDNLKRNILEDDFKHFLERAFSLGFTRQDIEDLMRRLLNHE